MSGHNAGGAQAILSDENDMATRNFLVSHVYPAVAGAWAKDNKAVIDSFHSLVLRKYLVPRSILPLWNVLLQSEYVKREQMALTTKAAQERRVAHMITKYEGLVPPFKKDYKSKGSGYNRFTITINQI